METEVQKCSPGERVDQLPDKQTNKLHIIQHDLPRMDGMNRQALQYKSKIDEMKLEKVSLAMTYEINIKKYQAHINSLERENMMLLNEVKKMESQVHHSEDRQKSEILLERLRLVDTQNSSLKMENEVQRHQYDRCLDDIANQVVTALLGQKTLREECSKLKDRVQELEIQNDQLTCLFQHQMRLSSDSFVQLQCRSGVTSPTKGDNYTVFLKSTESIKSMCSDYQAYEDPNTRSQEQIVSRGSSQSPLTSSMSTSPRNSSHRSSLGEQYRTKVETEFPASKDSVPKMKHISVLEAAAVPSGESVDQSPVFLSSESSQKLLDVCPLTSLISNHSNVSRNSVECCQKSTNESAPLGDTSRNKHFVECKNSILNSLLSNCDPKLLRSINHQSSPRKRQDHYSCSDVPLSLSTSQNDGPLTDSPHGFARSNSVDRSDGVRSSGWRWMNTRRSPLETKSQVELSDEDSDCVAPGYKTSTFSLNDLLDNSLDSAQESFFEDDNASDKNHVGDNLESCDASIVTTSTNQISGKVNFITSPHYDVATSQETNMTLSDCIPSSPLLNSSHRPRSLRLGCRTLTMNKNKASDVNSTVCDIVSSSTNSETNSNKDCVVDESNIDFPVQGVKITSPKRSSLLVESTTKIENKMQQFPNHTYPGKSKIETPLKVGGSIALISTSDKTLHGTLENIQTGVSVDDNVDVRIENTVNKTTLFVSTSPYTTMFYNKYKISRDKNATENNVDSNNEQLIFDEKQMCENVLRSIPNMTSSDSSCESIRAERSGSKDDGYSTMSSDMHPEIMEKLSDSSCESGKRHFSGKSEGSDAEVSPASHQSSPQERKKFDSQSFIGKLISPLFQRKFGHQNSQRKISSKNNSVKLSSIPSLPQKKSHVPVHNSSKSGITSKVSPLIQDQERKIGHETKIVSKHKNKTLVEINCRKLDVLKESSDFSDKMDNSYSEKDDSTLKNVVNGTNIQSPPAISGIKTGIGRLMKETQEITAHTNCLDSGLTTSQKSLPTSGASKLEIGKLQRSSIKTISHKATYQHISTPTSPIDLSRSTTSNKTEPPRISPPKQHNLERKRLDSSPGTSVCTEIEKPEMQLLNATDSKTSIVKSSRLNTNPTDPRDNKSDDKKDSSKIDIQNTDADISDSTNDSDKQVKPVPRAQSLLRQPSIKVKSKKTQMHQGATVNSANSPDIAPVKDTCKATPVNKLSNKSGMKVFSPPITPKSIDEAPSPLMSVKFQYPSKCVSTSSTTSDKVKYEAGDDEVKESLRYPSYDLQNSKEHLKKIESRSCKSPALRRMVSNLPERTKKIELDDGKKTNRISKSVDFGKGRDMQRSFSFSRHSDLSLSCKNPVSKVPPLRQQSCIPVSPVAKRSAELKLKSPELRPKSTDSNIKSPDVKLKSPELRPKSTDSNIKYPDVKLKSPELRPMSTDPNIKYPDVKLKSPELRPKSTDSNIKSPDVKLKCQEPPQKSPEVKPVECRSEMKRKTPPPVPPRSSSKQSLSSKVDQASSSFGKIVSPIDSEPPEVKLMTKKECEKTKLPVSNNSRNTGVLNCRRISPPNVAPKPRRLSNPTPPTSRESTELQGPIYSEIKTITPFPSGDDKTSSKMSVPSSRKENISGDKPSKLVSFFQRRKPTKLKPLAMQKPHDRQIYPEQSQHPEINPCTQHKIYTNPQTLSSVTKTTTTTNSKSKQTNLLRENSCYRKFSRDLNARITNMHRSRSDPILHKTPLGLCSSHWIMFRRCVSFSRFLEKASVDCDSSGRAKPSEEWLLAHTSRDLYNYSSESESEVEVRRRSYGCRRPHSIYRDYIPSVHQVISSYQRDLTKRRSYHEGPSYSSRLPTNPQSTSKARVTSCISSQRCDTSETSIISQIQDSSFEDDSSSGVDNPFNQDFYSLCRVESNRSLYSDAGSCGGSLSNIRAKVERVTSETRCKLIDSSLEPSGFNCTAAVDRSDILDVGSRGAGGKTDVGLSKQCIVSNERRSVCVNGEVSTIYPSDDSHERGDIGDGGKTQSIEDHKQCAMQSNPGLPAPRLHPHKHVENSHAQNHVKPNAHEQTSTSRVTNERRNTNMTGTSLCGSAIVDRKPFHDSHGDDLSYISKIDELHTSLSSLNSARTASSASNESLNRLDNRLYRSNRRVSGDDFHWENDEEMIYLSPYSTEIISDDGSPILEDVDAYDWPDSPYNTSDVDYHAQLHDFSEQSDAVFEEIMSRSMLRREVLLTGAEAIS